MVFENPREIGKSTRLKISQNRFWRAQGLFFLLKNQTKITSAFHSLGKYGEQPASLLYTN